MRNGSKALLKSALYSTAIIV
ncbi:hypothetical protein CY0110_17042 [Crocosphaera chwakensis CCY0110]|uniref:Uncharacterized protein n=1 Tax=Crocosphaera chwakensis CCY0110 TaxID=391612 RepID=A3II90_9CHRO|nr:hypothetical protein CY0110_17042 [Crocosphaera chwakensis CCY0110]